MKKTNVSAKRIFEQVNIGYIKQVEKNKFVLTKKAKNFEETSRIISDIFKIKRTYLWPEKVF